MSIGTRVKTRCGSRKRPYWVYGTITNICPDSYRIQWDEGGYDYLCSCEFELA